MSQKVHMSTKNNDVTLIKYHVTASSVFIKNSLNTEQKIRSWQRKFMKIIYGSRVQQCIIMLILYT